MLDTIIRPIQSSFPIKTNLSVVFNQNKVLIFIFAGLNMSFGKGESLLTFNSISKALPSKTSFAFAASKIPKQNRQSTTNPYQDSFKSVIQHGHSTNPPLFPHEGSQPVESLYHPRGAWSSIRDGVCEPS